MLFWYFATFLILWFAGRENFCRDSLSKRSTNASPIDPLALPRVKTRIALALNYPAANRKAVHLNWDCATFNAFGLSLSLWMKLTEEAPCCAVLFAKTFTTEFQMPSRKFYWQKLLPGNRKGSNTGGCCGVGPSRFPKIWNSESIWNWFRIDSL